MDARSSAAPLLLARNDTPTTSIARPRRPPSGTSRESDRPGAGSVVVPRAIRDPLPDCYRWLRGARREVRDAPPVTRALLAGLGGPALLDGLEHLIGVRATGADPL